MLEAYAYLRFLIYCPHCGEEILFIGAPAIGSTEECEQCASDIQIKGIGK